MRLMADEPTNPDTPDETAARMLAETAEADSLPADSEAKLPGSIENKDPAPCGEHTRTHINEIRLQSWHHFVNFANLLDVGSVVKLNYVFRGHSNASWRLQPSLLRRLHSPLATDQQVLELEEYALAEFRSQVHRHVSPNVLSTTTDIVSWWTLMQQHGAPTRLMDWSQSIYVAAYFAVTDDLDVDGAVWIVHAHSVHQRMDELYDFAALPKTVAAVQLAFLQPNAPNALLFGWRLSKSDRMISQQGLFAICRNVLGDHEQILADALAGPSKKLLLCKLLVPASLKVSFARKLRTMNITANSLFPGLDGLGRSIAELVQLGVQ